MNAAGALVAAGAGAGEFGAIEFGVFDRDAGLDEATPAPPPWSFSLELQLDIPIALIAPRTAKVSTIRPGVQKGFLFSVLDFADEAICLKSCRN